MALLPALIAMTLVQIGPMLVGVVMAFFRLTQFTIGNWLEAPFAGLQNITLAVNPTEPIGREFWGSMGLTALYTVLVVGIAWVFGMAGAVFLSDQFRGRGLLRSLFILPYAIPAYAGVMIWTFMFQSNGAINTLLGRDLHLLSSQTFWLSGAKAFGAILVAGVWQMWPFAFLMLLAGIQGVPGELYEAARVDGATRWTEFRDITLPVTRDVSRVLVLITGLWTFNNFTTPYVMFGNAPPASTNLVSLQIYINSFVDLNFGLGAAMAVIMIAILVIIALLYIRLLRLNVGEVPNG
ncbi:MAG: ABC transporter permease [Sulfobacillus acidophilus]|uniref:ABC transporter permease n=1 Tax=Sulfobacillus acidophilus TaxID=53633 RepID=A0A2T2WKC7_9FIRM|nr:MAG: ABC transporter permease [Sulfobacillus acidophilus]